MVSKLYKSQTTKLHSPKIHLIELITFLIRNPDQHFNFSKPNTKTLQKSIWNFHFFLNLQIHYLDEHDINGFIVQVNTDPLLQCTTMTETYNSGSKSNSCFTAGIHYLKADDRITIKDIETNRYSIFKPEKSFFGLMKVGAVP